MAEGVSRELTEQSLSLFLFQCFLADLVLAVDRREACGCTLGLSNSRFCREREREGDTKQLTHLL